MFEAEKAKLLAGKKGIAAAATPRTGSKRIVSTGPDASYERLEVPGPSMSSFPGSCASLDTYRLSRGVPPKAAGCLWYVPDALSEDDETCLLRAARHPQYTASRRWVTLKTRRLQNWGGMVREAGLCEQEPLPSWLRPVARAVHSAGAMRVLQPSCKIARASSDPTKVMDASTDLSGTPRPAPVLASCPAAASSCTSRATDALGQGGASGSGSRAASPLPAAGLDPVPNHVLVNEYRPGEGILPHSDGPAYRPAVAILSLGSSAIMRFVPRVAPGLVGTEEHRARERAESFCLVLRPRSLLVFSGHVYSGMLHGIRAVASEIVPGHWQAGTGASLGEKEDGDGGSSGASSGAGAAASSGDGGDGDGESLDMDMDGPPCANCEEAGCEPGDVVERGVRVSLTVRFVPPASGSGRDTST